MKKEKEEEERKRIEREKELKENHEEINKLKLEIEKIRNEKEREENEKILFEREVREMKEKMDKLREEIEKIRNEKESIAKKEVRGMFENDKKACSMLGLKDPTLVGIGVFGRVYKAQNQKDGKSYCVKIIPSEKFNEEEYNISERLKEKRSKNLIVFSQKQEFPKFKLVGLVMEYMNGGDLKSYIDNYNRAPYLSPKEIYNFVKQICLNFYMI
jgi:hypothetical protein